MASGDIRPRDQLLSRVPHFFRDVITDEPPRNEVQLSGLLALFHNLKRIDWGRVELEVVDPGRTSRAFASSLGMSDLVAVCEYPLFFKPRSEAEQMWGGYRADVLFVGKSRGPLIYVENKIGHAIKGHFISGVLRCLEQQTHFSEPGFVILTGRQFNPNWYRSELRNVLQKTELKLEKTKSYMMFWEDIFTACAAA